MSKYRVIGGVTAALCSTAGLYSLGAIRKPTDSAVLPPRRADDRLAGLKLVNVHSFVRHGARTPIHTIETIEPGVYDKDVLMGVLPHTDIDYQVVGVDGGLRPRAPMEHFYRSRTLEGGCYPGQLTKLGQDQMYEYGRSLRSLYVDQFNLISPEFKPEEIYVRSTNIVRCVESVRSAVAGLYGGASKFSSNEPLCIYTSDPKDEVLYPNTYHCPKMRSLFVTWIKKAWDMKPMKDLRQEVENRTGYIEKNGRFLNLIDVRDDLMARKAHGLRIPENLEQLLPDIEMYATLIAKIQLCGPEEETHLNLSVGSVLNMVRENMDKSNEKSYKLYIYSSHDSFLLPLAVSVGIFDDKWVPYAGDVRFELYRDSSGDKYVRTLYCGKETVMTGCDSGLVPFSKFKSVIAPYALSRESYDEKCGTNIEQLEEKRHGHRKKHVDETTTAAGM